MRGLLSAMSGRGAELPSHAIESVAKIARACRCSPARESRATPLRNGVVEFRTPLAGTAGHRRAPRTPRWRAAWSSDATRGHSLKPRPSLEGSSESPVCCHGRTPGHLRLSPRDTDVGKAESASEGDDNSFVPRTRPRGNRLLCRVLQLRPPIQFVAGCLTVAAAPIAARGRVSSPVAP
jgi:hypothetical protein